MGKHGRELRNLKQLYDSYKFIDNYDLFLEMILLLEQEWEVTTRAEKPNRVLNSYFQNKHNSILQHLDNLKEWAHLNEKRKHQPNNE